MRNDEWQALSERAYGSWSRGDLDGWLDVLAPECVFVAAGAFPDVDGEYRGHEEMRRFWRELRAPFDSFAIVAERIEPLAADEAVADVRFTATGKGSGARVELEFFHRVTARDGRVIRLSSHETRAEALADAGA